tara:strand:+ start:8754 stop:9530 length:777 start_codon:yes stop_codon:yes gene_type:complete
VPELIEVDLYRKAAESALGRTIASVAIPNETYLVGDTDLSDFQSVLYGCQLRGVRRIGKLLLLDLGAVSVGMRFGMTGRLIVDGEPSIDQLLYTTNEVKEKHLRCVITFEEQGALSMIDPRRFGNVELGPEEGQLGPDAATITSEELTMFQSSSASIKALLLNQKRIAGLGNLLCDEIMWRSGVNPTRGGRTMETTDIELLASTIRGTISELSDRGGSHMGDLQSERRQGGSCPIDGSELERDTVAGRTTWWCPEHQL